MSDHTGKRPNHSNVPNRNRGMAESASMVAIDLTALPTLSHAELKSRWTETFDAVPPKGLSRRLLICALAYEIQTMDQGRLKPATRKRLFQIGTPDSSTPTEKVSPLTPGTRLMREWRGTVHVVDVTEDGLVWNGRTYSSLSAIARTITGTRWSGNRFFGLRKRSDAMDKSRTGRARISNHHRLQDFTLQSDGPHYSNRVNGSRQSPDAGLESKPIQNTDDIGAERSPNLPDIVDVALSQTSANPEPESAS